MPVMASVSINDGQATPVAHIFTPTSTKLDAQGANVAQWHDRAPSQAIGWPSLTYGVREPVRKAERASATGFYDIKIKLDYPVLEALAPAGNGYTPAPTVAYSLGAQTIFKLPERATKQEITDLIVLQINALQVLKTEMINREPRF